MRVTASKLRENIYGMLDQALETGVPIEVVRKGKVLKIVPETQPDRLARLKKRKCIIGDPEDIVHMDWLSEWSEPKK
jgi:antitoxin (DNA-binding transcriptional repressor) of toxin-antitoxin stability system